MSRPDIVVCVDLDGPVTAIVSPVGMEPYASYTAVIEGRGWRLELTDSDLTGLHAVVDGLNKDIAVHDINAGRVA